LERCPNVCRRSHRLLIDLFDYVTLLDTRVGGWSSGIDLRYGDPLRGSIHPELLGEFGS
jgi:hypothetical protein